MSRTLLAVLIWATAALGIPRAAAQGSFQNLNFESANIINVPGAPGTILLGPAFPGWQFTANGQPRGTALHGNVSTTPALALFGPDSNAPEGQYFAALQASTFIGTAEAVLSQSGLVPFDALSLRFVGTPLNSLAGQFTVSLNNTPLPLTPLGQVGQNVLYGADVSAFAGQVAELRFRNAVTIPGESVMQLDAIQFSTAAVPEPGTIALALLGSALLALGLRRR